MAPAHSKPVNPHETPERPKKKAKNGHCISIPSESCTCGECHEDIHLSPIPSPPETDPSPPVEHSPPIAQEDQDFALGLLQDALETVAKENAQALQEETRRQEEEKAKRCAECGEEVCMLDQHWNEFCECADGILEFDHTPKQSRFQMCKVMSRFICGYLGKGVRMQLPVCVEDAIKGQFPDDNGNCTGFKESTGKNEK